MHSGMLLVCAFNMYNFIISLLLYLSTYALQSSISELAITFKDPEGAFGSSKRNHAADASRHESGDWVQPKARYGESHPGKNHGGNGAASGYNGTSTSTTPSAKKGEDAWDDWRSIDAVTTVDDWEGMKFEQSNSFMRHNRTESNSNSNDMKNASVNQFSPNPISAVSTTSVSASDVPKQAPVVSLTSLLNRDEMSDSAAASHSSSSSALNGSGKYLHSQQQDIRDTWTRERSGRGPGGVFQPSHLPPSHHHPSSHPSSSYPPQRTPQMQQQQSDLATMRNNLFVQPPLPTASTTLSSTLVAPASSTATPTATVSTLTDEQKRYVCIQIVANIISYIIVYS